MIDALSDDDTTQLAELRSIHAQMGLSSDELARAERLCWKRVDEVDVWRRVMGLIGNGGDLVPSVLLAAFDAWPKGPIEPGLDESLESSVYNRCAPELRLMERLQSAAGTRFLGGFVDFDHAAHPGSWCENRTRDHAIALIERIVGDEE